MRRMRWLLPLLLAACASSPEDGPYGGGVRLASTFGEVADCVRLGTVTSSEPAGRDAEATDELLRQAAGLGADVLYIPSVSAKPGRSGIAYRCGGT